jgi:hypothetical protein
VLRDGTVTGVVTAQPRGLKPLSQSTRRCGGLNIAHQIIKAISIDELNVDRETVKKQYVFWTAVVLGLGFIMFAVL